MEGLIPATVPETDHDGGGIPPTGIGIVFLYECFAGLYDISATDVPVQAETDLPSAPVTGENEVGDISLRIDYANARPMPPSATRRYPAFLRAYACMGQLPVAPHTQEPDIRTTTPFPSFPSETPAISTRSKPNLVSQSASTSRRSGLFAAAWFQLR